MLKLSLPYPAQLLICLAALFLIASPADAGQRKFAFSYESTTSPQGAVELENWVTWKHDGADGNAFEFRHELEFGVTDRLQLGIYLADWSYSDAVGAVYEHSGVEAIYNLTNPTTDFLGSAVYLEVVGGNDVAEVEGKLLLQKNVGPLVVAYNLVLEGKWEGENLDEREGEFAQTLGVSYELNPHFSIGVEAFHEIPLPDWKSGEDSIVFAGPNASVRFGRFFVTAACLAQLTDIEGEPDWENRMIVGFDF
ncbi:MAG: hypothetical protein ABIT76_02330 [Chthoniobacterales bacterium]